jgi:hypothetical protein
MVNVTIPLLALLCNRTIKLCNSAHLFVCPLLVLRRILAALAWWKLRRLGSKVLVVFMNKTGKHKLAIIALQPPPDGISIQTASLLL